MKYNFNEFIILAGYKHEFIKDYFIKYVEMNNDIFIDTSTNKIKIIDRIKENFKVTILNTGNDQIQVEDY